MQKKGIAAAGNLIVDYVKSTDSYPAQGNLATITEMRRSVGGAVPNVLIDLAKLDAEVPLEAIGMVGKDGDGELLLQELQKNGIDVSKVKTVLTSGTSFTDVMSSRETGERTFFQYRGANAELKERDFDFDRIKAEILHVGYALLLDGLDAADPQYGTVMAAVLKKAQDHGIKTSMDVVSENSDRFSRIVPPSLRYTDYCVINEVEAEKITGIPARQNGRLCFDNLEKMCRSLLKMGIGSWAIIHAPEAGCGMGRDGTFSAAPSIDVPKSLIKGKVGAGDAFCAGVLYAAYRNWSLEKALQVGTAAATCSLREANATDGMLPFEETMRLYEQYPLEERDFGQGIINEK